MRTYKNFCFCGLTLCRCNHSSWFEDAADRRYNITLPYLLCFFPVTAWFNAYSPPVLILLQGLPVALHMHLCLDRVKLRVLDYAVVSIMLSHISI
jgi:antibiotic biosynthesis monooxygenase (ABM) superfamily enzyme